MDSSTFKITTLFLINRKRKHSEDSFQVVDIHVLDFQGKKDNNEPKEDKATNDDSVTGRYLIATELAELVLHLAPGYVRRKLNEPPPKD